ncbi:hypothetical protein B0H12DRAFT_662863 [Mycena haematopus]|nr:hypothetical protein B0H12DRAFT_662863 [Mycena haematopus]
MADFNSEESLRYSCPKCLHVFSLSDVDPTPALVSSDIVKSNNPPLESQIPVLQDFISKGRARLAALETKMALLDSLMHKLLEEKDELAVEISIHEKSLSSLRRMPTEILSHIFSFTLPPHQSDAAPAPWAISAVCARWRAIVISQPHFWTFIRYIASSHGGKAPSDDYAMSDSESSSHGPVRLKPKPQLLKFKTQLRRSAQLPLNVEFHMVPLRQSYMTLEQERILQLICDHGERWETASFVGPQDLSDQLRFSVPHQLAHLQKLTIDIPYDDGHYGNDPVEIFQDAPLLHTVSSNRRLWQYPATLELPWSQLRRYGGSNKWDNHLDALRRTSNLVDCSLEIPGPVFPLQNPLFYHICVVSLCRIPISWNVSRPPHSRSCIAIMTRPRSSLFSTSKLASCRSWSCGNVPMRKQILPA